MVVLGGLSLIFNKPKFESHRNLRKDIGIELIRDAIIAVLGKALICKPFEMHAKHLNIQIYILYPKM